eukprot:6485924-Pyramimonas_sp.AAC.1
MIASVPPCWSPLWLGPAGPNVGFKIPGCATNGKCPRCADEKEDLKHRCWKCPSNDSMQNTAVLTTSHLCARADAAAPDSSLWSRGLPPLA